jgi:hypothetical protein
MPSQKTKMNEKFTFEYYDADNDDYLDAEVSEVIEEYNPVNFESELNEEQLLELDLERLERSCIQWQNY